MKQSCPKCKTLIEINEKEYQPGSVVEKQCPLCDEKVKYAIPLYETENKESFDKLYEEMTIIKNQINEIRSDGSETPSNPNHIMVDAATYNKQRDALDNIQRAIEEDCGSRVDDVDKYVISKFKELKSEQETARDYHHSAATTEEELIKIRKRIDRIRNIISWLAIVSCGFIILFNKIGIGFFVNNTLEAIGVTIAIISLISLTVIFIISEAYKEINIEDFLFFTENGLTMIDTLLVFSIVGLHDLNIIHLGMAGVIITLILSLPLIICIIFTAGLYIIGLPVFLISSIIDFFKKKGKKQ